MKRDKRLDTNIEYMAGPVTSINYDELESTPVLVHRREKRAAARRAQLGDEASGASYYRPHLLESETSFVRELRPCLLER